MAAQQAQRDEQARQAQIAKQIKSINWAFTSRQPEYNDYVAALRSQYGLDLGQQKDIADRQQKFALARSHLTGGSAAVDAGKLTGREYQKGLIGIENQAQSSLADLVAQDERTRQSLISLAQSGNYTSNGAIDAARLLKSNISGAKSNALSSDIGTIFGGTADLYKKQQELAAQRRGLQSSNIYANPWTKGY